MINWFWQSATAIQWEKEKAFEQNDVGTTGYS